VPPELQRLLDTGPMITGRAYADYCNAAFAAFDGKAGRLLQRNVVAASCLSGQNGH